MPQGVGAAGQTRTPEKCSGGRELGGHNVYETGLQLGDGLGHGEGGVGPGEHLEHSEECTDGECGVVYTV